MNFSNVHSLERTKGIDLETKAVFRYPLGPSFPRWVGPETISGGPSQRRLSKDEVKCLKFSTSLLGVFVPRIKVRPNFRLCSFCVFLFKVFPGDSAGQINDGTKSLQTVQATGPYPPPHVGLSVSRFISGSS